MGDQETAPSYDLATIRSLLRAVFTAQELRRFCVDRTIFRPIISKLGPSFSLDDMIDQVLDHCQTQLLWDELLAAVKTESPRQYARFEAELWGTDTGVESVKPSVPKRPSQVNLSRQRSVSVQFCLMCGMQLEDPGVPCPSCGSFQRSVLRGDESDARNKRLQVEELNVPGCSARNIVVFLPFILVLISGVLIYVLVQRSVQVSTDATQTALAWITPSFPSTPLATQTDTPTNTSSPSLTPTATPRNTPTGAPSLLTFTPTGTPSRTKAPPPPRHTAKPTPWPYVYTWAGGKANCKLTWVYGHVLNSAGTPEADVQMRIGNDQNWRDDTRTDSRGYYAYVLAESPKAGIWFVQVFKDGRPRSMQFWWETSAGCDDAYSLQEIEIIWQRR